MAQKSPESPSLATWQVVKPHPCSSSHLLKWLDLDIKGQGMGNAKCCEIGAVRRTERRTREWSMTRFLSASKLKTLSKKKSQLSSSCEITVKNGGVVS